MSALHYEKGFVRFAEKGHSAKLLRGAGYLRRQSTYKGPERRKEEGRAKVGIKGGAGGPPSLGFQSGLSVAVVVLIVIVAQMEIVLSF